MDERTVQSQLKALDPRLRLVQQFDPDAGMYYEVVCVWSAEHDARSVYKHRAGGGIGEPLPLSSRVVEEVKRLREVDTLKASDDANARLREQIRKDSRDAALAISDDHKPYVDRGRVQITTASVRRPKPYWQRNKHLREEAA